MAMLQFLGGDARMTWAKARVQTLGLEVGAEHVTHLVLPVPAFDAAGDIRGGPSFAEVTGLLRPGLTVLGGGMKARLPALEQAGCRVVDLLEDEQLAARNAAITAEGAVSLAMQHLPCTLSGAAVLLLGWGRIGRLLSQKLAHLGADVWVCARKARDLGLIAALGLHPLALPGPECAAGWGDLRRFRVIFNTVPAPVLELRDPGGTLLVELASAPGGICCPGHVLDGGGLPGKYAPESAGIAIGDAIFRWIGEENHA